MTPGTSSEKNRVGESKGKRGCIRCGGLEFDNEGKCNNCGQTQNRVRCLECGAFNLTIEKFCGRCGSELDSTFLPLV